MFNDLQQRAASIAGIQLKCGWARGSKQLPADIALHVYHAIHATYMHACSMIHDT